MLRDKRHIENSLQDIGCKRATRIVIGDYKDRKNICLERYSFSKITLTEKPRQTTTIVNFVQTNFRKPYLTVYEVDIRQ
jgi:hypothetical protein